MFRVSDSPVLGYREHAPPPELAAWVECFWGRHGSGGDGNGAPLRVMPDGCADVLVEIDASGAPSATVIGPMTRALVVPGGSRSRYVGVRFLPGAAAAFLGAPLRHLVDRRVGLEELWQDGEGVGERVAERAEGGTPVAALAAELLARRGRATPPDARIGAAIRRLSRGPETAPIGQLAAELGWSRQHLARRFADEVGYGPKRLARILRLRRAVELVGTRAPLVGVALMAGYYDQQHMCADFRALAGVAPRELRG